VRPADEAATKPHGSAAAAGAPLLDVAHVSKRFDSAGGAILAIDDVSFSVAQGRFVSIIGPSGCGKSTLFNIIGGLIGGYDGRVSVSGETVRGTHPSIGMVFQEQSTFPWRTVLENVAFPLEIAGVPKTERHARAERFIAMVGLAGFAARYPAELSGGMRQRVAIAIALLNRPDLVIADEPTTALDVTIQGQILYEMQKLTQETGTALIWITHDLSVIAGLADRVCVMYAGRIVEQGSAQAVLGAPRHPYTRGLLDSVPSNNTRGGRLAQIPGMTPSLLELPRALT